jgi:hypothetical protein
MSLETATRFESAALKPNSQPSSLNGSDILSQAHKDSASESPAAKPNVVSADGKQLIIPSPYNSAESAQIKTVEKDIADSSTKNTQADALAKDAVALLKESSATGTTHAQSENDTKQAEKDITQSLKDINKSQDENRAASKLIGEVEKETKGDSATAADGRGNEQSLKGARASLVEAHQADADSHKDITVALKDDIREGHVTTGVTEIGKGLDKLTTGAKDMDEAKKDLNEKKTTPPPPPPDGKKDQVFVINMENTSLSQVLGQSYAPYMNSLTKQGELYTDSTGVHGSFTDYVTQLAGQSCGVPGSFVGNLKEETVADQLIALGNTKGIAPDQMFGQYDENLNGKDWVSRHDATLAFTSLAKQDPALVHDFNTEFGKGGYANAPAVNFITPDLDDDEHGDSTPPKSRAELIAAADTWMKEKLDPLIQYAEHNSNVRVVITTDEPDLGAPASTPMYTVVLGKGITAGSTDNTHVTQASITHSIQEMFGLATLPGEYDAPPLQGF